MAELVKTAMGWNFASGRLGEQIMREIVDLVAQGEVHAVVGDVVGFDDIPAADHGHGRAADHRPHHRARRPESHGIERPTVHRKPARFGGSSQASLRTLRRWAADDASSPEAIGIRTSKEHNEMAMTPLRKAAAGAALVAATLTGGALGASLVSGTASAQTSSDSTSSSAAPSTPTAPATPPRATRPLQGRPHRQRHHRDPPHR